MPISDAALLVARFLKSNNYVKTLDAFIQEAGLDEDAGSTKPGDWTIEQILREKQQFDTSLAYERKDAEASRSWTTIAPSRHHEPQIVTQSNVLCVYGDEEQNLIISTGADKSLKYILGEEPFAAAMSGFDFNDSPILSVKKAGDFLLSTSMSGYLNVQQISTRQLVDKRRNHNKYTVDVASFREDDCWVVATAGWDGKIVFRTPQITESGMRIGDIAHTQTLPTNPESMIFVRHPDTRELYLVASRRDSTHLYYYHISFSSQTIVVTESGRQNLAPHSNAWVAFTPCSLSQCPGDPTLIAIATSHIPHMKLIIVRLLFPDPETTESTNINNATQASAARAEIALQDREDAAIKLHVTTMAPQTPYSTPQVVWRPDATGLYVNGDDGIIRGIEASSGKVISTLRGHEVGSKVRTLWAGKMKRKDNNEAEEILVSGGFDKKLLVWTT